MNQLQKIFDYQGAQLRTVIRAGEPWFVAKDACDILEIGNPSQAISRLDEDEKNTIILNEGIGNPEKSIVSESGLYSLILGSRKPEAKLFKRWITHDVIPSIRKHGMYAKDELLENPDLFIEALTKLKEERQARLALEARVEADRPKVIFAEALEVSNSTILIGELAKLLKQNGIEIGQNRLFERLRKEGYLGNKGEYYNIPTQRSMELGLFEIKTRSINNPDGSIRVTKTTKVTGKGQIHFINKFKILINV